MLSVFYTCLQDFDDSFIDYLNDSDRKQAHTISNTTRRKTFITGRALLATALDHCCGQADYRLRYNDKGKPLLVLPPRWHFNLSHSGRHLMLGIQQSQPLGLDCEVVKDKFYERVAKKIFSENDYQNIITSTLPQQHFYALWTQHEARVKLAGQSVFSLSESLPTAPIKTYAYGELVFSLCSRQLDCPITFFRQNLQKNHREFISPENLFSKN